MLAVIISGAGASLSPARAVRWRMSGVLSSGPGRNHFDDLFIMEPFDDQADGTHQTEWSAGPKSEPKTDRPTRLQPRERNSA